MHLLEAITQRRLLAIIRADNAERALRCMRTLIDAGVTAMEVSLTTPGGLDAITRARSQCPPAVLIGAGTVLTADQADAASAAGAGFIVTPGITPGARHAAATGVPLLCGALTPTEVITALNLGATAVKIFPAGPHGPGYVRELRAPLPQAPLVAVGGVDCETAPQYLAAGAVAVGVGSPLLGLAGTTDAPQAHDDLANRAAAFLEAVEPCHAMGRNRRQETR